MSVPRLFPVFLELGGRPVVIVGGGEVACAKLSALLDAKADVTVVAPSIRPEMARTSVRLVCREFRPSDLDGAWLAVAAAPPEVNRSVAHAAAGRRIFVNAVDDTASASAYFGGVVKKTGVTVAISTGGRAPALAGLLREAFEELLPDDLAGWLAVADDERRHWKANEIPMRDRRPLLLAALNGLYARKEAER
jgi:siroheme synthase-like protein